MPRVARRFTSTRSSRTPLPRIFIPNLPTWDGGDGLGTPGPRAGCTARAWSGSSDSGSKAPHFASGVAFLRGLYSAPGIERGGPDMHRHLDRVEPSQTDRR